MAERGGPEGLRYPRLAEALARRRVALGFVFGAIVLALARPTARSLAIGMSVSLCGEALRIWASGHLNKAREVTSSGPYRWFAHPLYVGSSIMGVGLAIASAHALPAALIVVYLATTLSAAIRTEAVFLRSKFGEDYERYRGGAAATGGQRSTTQDQRPFRLSQAIANREHRTVIGFAVAVLLLVLKGTYNGMFWRAAGP